jgi:2-haloalkanoic acid dehalogenase type II
VSKHQIEPDGVSEAMPIASARRIGAPRVVTFDFYTALVDCVGSLLPVVRAVCGDHVDALALTRAWRTRQLEWAQLSNSLQRGRIPFRECTRRALVYTFARIGRTLSQSQVAELVAAWDSLTPWPEANATLAAIKARGYPIGVLSNGDEAMLRAGRHPACRRFSGRRNGREARGPTVRLVEPRRRAGDQRRRPTARLRTARSRGPARCAAARTEFLNNSGAGSARRLATDRAPS